MELEGSHVGVNGMKFEMELDAERMIGSVQIIERKLQDQQNQSIALNGQAEQNLQAETARPAGDEAKVKQVDVQVEDEEESQGLEISVDTENANDNVLPRPSFLIAKQVESGGGR